METLPTELILSIFSHLSTDDKVLCMTLISGVWRRRLLPLSAIVFDSLSFPLHAAVLFQYRLNTAQLASHCHVLPFRLVLEGTRRTRRFLRTAAWNAAAKNTRTPRLHLALLDSGAVAAFFSTQQHTGSLVKNTTILELANFESLSISSIANVVSLCKSLKSLVLRNPLAPKQSLTFLSTFPTLKSLTLAGTSLATIPPKLATYIPSLVNLTLSHIKVENVGNIRSLAPFTTLRSLHLLNLESQFSEDLTRFVTLFLTASATSPLCVLGLSVHPSRAKLSMAACPIRVSLKDVVAENSHQYCLYLGKCQVSFTAIQKFMADLAESRKKQKSDAVDTSGGDAVHTFDKGLHHHYAIQKGSTPADQTPSTTPLTGSTTPKRKRSSSASSSNTSSKSDSESTVLVERHHSSRASVLLESCEISPTDLVLMREQFGSLVEIRSVLEIK
ncbi:hypothetical protein HDU98_009007 [Podochytrium sp. JEL0797]|nr:hypothetical protein HDU98_009007 [Podochytrium sp. JEL0797]